jgi:hypothetical protein
MNSMEKAKKALESAVKTYCDAMNKEMKGLQSVNRRLTLEKQYLLECLNETDQDKVKKNCVYVLLYSRDNGEGIDTYTCCGVFRKRSKATAGKLSLVNDGCCVASLEVKECDMSCNVEELKELNVFHCDNKEHGEMFTYITGIEGQVEDNIISDDMYKRTFVLDELVGEEELEF